MRSFYALVLFMSAGLLLSAVVQADTIPPNPFVSRLESPDPRAEPARAQQGPVSEESSALAAEIGLEVMGVVSSGETTILIMKQGVDRVFSVAVGEQIDNSFTLVKVGERYATFNLQEDNTRLELELPGVEDE